MSSPSDEALATTYEIVVRAELDDDLVSEVGARSFGARRGRTLIVVDVIDQSHLHGVLGWLHSRNIEIERINPV